MGRKSKGDRHTFMTRVPVLAGQRIKFEAETLGCYYTDYLAYAICQHVGVPAEVPRGEVRDHPEPPAAPGGRVQFMAKVPMEAAVIVKAEAERQGISLSDYIAKALCDLVNVSFQPRVKAKAVKAWQSSTGKPAETAARNARGLPMTG